MRGRGEENKCLRPNLSLGRVLIRQPPPTHPPKERAAGQEVQDPGPGHHSQVAEGEATLTA